MEAKELFFSFNHNVMCPLDTPLMPIQTYNLTMDGFMSSEVAQYHGVPYAFSLNLFMCER